MDLTQEVLNEMMRDRGIARARRKTQSAIDRGKETESGSGALLLSQVAPRVAKELEVFCQRKVGVQVGHSHRRLTEMPFIVSAVIGTRTVLDSISYQRDYYDIIAAIGKELSYEAWWRFIRRKAGPLFNEMMSNLGKATDPHRHKVIVGTIRSDPKLRDAYSKWSVQEKLAVGAVILEELKAQGIVDITVVWNHIRRVRARVVTPTEGLLEWRAKSHADTETLCPMYMPTVGVPLDWMDMDSGGYGLEVFGRGLVKIKHGQDEKWIRANLTVEKAPKVFAAVNAVQRLPWRINKPVLEVYRKMADLGIPFAGLPGSEFWPLPAKPADFDENPEAKKKWKMAAAGIHGENARAKSLRMLANRITSTASELSECERFHFPHQLDFRGRFYPMPPVLSPQGPSLAKGLLEFAESKRKDRKWLGIAGANAWGKDKETLADREMWACTDGTSIAIEVAADPVGKRVLWEDTDSPWEFLAWCFDWAGQGGDSRFPCFQDASNNGLQLFSLLLRDPDGAKATNVSPSDVRQDIYMEVARAATEVMRERGEEADVHWLKFYGGELPRDLVKRPVMTLPYGVTAWSVHAYVRDHAKDACRKDGKVPKLDWGLTRHLSRSIWGAIEARLPGAVKCMKWLQECASLAAKIGRGIHWTNPVGFPVSHRYRSTGSKPIDLLTTRRRLQIRVPQDTGALRTHKQKNAVSPNLVHSLDAAVLCEAIHRSPVTPGVIHDSFGTHSCDVAAFGKVLRETVADIFFEDLLEDFRHQAQLSAGISLPPPPKRGSLDPQCVLQSDYLFS